MLTGLSIRDVVLIESLDLHLEQGFTALTGETGAGKSILLDSLSLALGMRGDTLLIRQGAEQAVVTAEFDLSSLVISHPLRALLQEQGFDPEHNPLILRRVLHRTNKSRALVNDHPVSIGLLKEIGNLILEIHGQFDNLLVASTHHKILDRFAISYHPEMSELLEQLDKAYHHWKEAEIELKEESTRQEEAIKKQAYYVQLLEDLDKLAPQQNEEEALIQQRHDIAHYGKITEAVQAALQSLRLPADIQSTLYSIQKNLERANTIGLKDLTNVCEGLERAGIEIQEASETLRTLYSLNQDASHQLSTIDERLYAIRALARKYGFHPVELYESYEQAKLTISALEEGEDRLIAFEKKVEKNKNEYLILAEKVHSIRLKTAKALEELIMEELPDLKLSQAVFKVAIDKSKTPTSFGIDQVEFMVAINKGQELSPLVKSASGGEMARLMLALKVVLTKHGYISTIVFDEIDTGVGGAIANAIGKRLAGLGKHVQVLAITHSPQVAACADQHFKVAKYEQTNKTITTIDALIDEERTEEIARMLAGAIVTPEARAAAVQLLESPL